MTRPACPGCGESALTSGRTLCQACALTRLTTTGTPGPARRGQLAEAALALAGRGWHVFPCQPGAKTPALRADWEHRATTSPARIARCWAAGPWNIGIACGPSGLVVIDLDKPKPGQAPPAQWSGVPGIRDGADVLAGLCEHAGQPWPGNTYTVATPSGGTHLYYTAPPGPPLGNTAGDRGRGLGWLIDTRASGGYVLGPGSVIGGTPYQVTHPAAPAPLPAWLAARLAASPPDPARPAPAASPGTPLAAGYALAALRGEIDRVLAARPGTRNATLNHAAFALGQLTAAGILPPALARDALHRAAATTGLPPGEAARTITSGLTAGARQPRTAA